MSFFIKRGEKVQGPFSREQIVLLAKAKKIKDSDRIGNSSQGPFQELGSVWESFSDPQSEKAKAGRSQEEIESPVPAITEVYIRPTDMPKHKETNKTPLIIGALSSLVVLLSVVIVALLIQLNSLSKSLTIAINNAARVPSGEMEQASDRLNRATHDDDTDAQAVPAIKAEAATVAQTPDAETPVAREPINGDAAKAACRHVLWCLPVMLSQNSCTSFCWHIALVAACRRSGAST